MSQPSNRCSTLDIKFDSAWSSGATETAAQPAQPIRTDSQGAAELSGLSLTLGLVRSVRRLSMSPNPSQFELPADFTGRVRIFPLPNLVLFPSVIQPLHIFELRYCQLLEDALASDGLIAMTLLKPGWEKEYDGRPEIESMGCLGRIAAHARQADGRYNIFLQGVHRARVSRELPPKRNYREANVDLVGDYYPADGAARRAETQRELLRNFRHLVPASSKMGEQFDQCSNQPPQLGLLTDVIAFTASLDFRAKQRLLIESNVDRRAETLLEYLRDRDTARDAVARRRFPPDFSDN